MNVLEHSSPTNLHNTADIFIVPGEETINQNQTQSGSATLSHTLDMTLPRTYILFYYISIYIYIHTQTIIFIVLWTGPCVDTIALCIRIPPGLAPMRE